MTTDPGRAPYNGNEDYAPLRKPKGYSYPSEVSSQFNVHAEEFVPRTRANGQQLSGFFNEQAQQQEQQMYLPQQSHQSEYYQNNYQQQQQNHQSAYSNNHYQNPHKQQQQHQYPKQTYYPQNATPNMVNCLGKSVQDRLRINDDLAYSEAQQYSDMNSYQPDVVSYASNHQYNHNQNLNDSNGVMFNNFKQSNVQRNRGHNQPHHHQQRHSHSYKGNYDSYGNSGNSSRGSYDHTAGGPSSNSNDVEKIALDYLQTVIQCLNQNPGQFDTIATRFLTIFDGMENNSYVLSIAMEDIFKESIDNTNFRYMGAKLYNLLHMLDFKKDSLFQNLLKCKLDFHKAEVREYMQKKQHTHVCNTALFLAELYMQLRGDDTRIRLIAENIVYSLKQLLQSESPENIRCVCLTLKLAGYDLTADCPEEMREIIATLEKCNQSAPGKYPLAANVISLQKNNWGRRTDSWNSLSDASDAGSTAYGGAAGNAAALQRSTDEPIFYGPDGKELTAEESEFLAMSGNGEALVDEDFINDLDVDYDPEMDEETEKDYVEFCKLNQSK